MIVVDALEAQAQEHSDAASIKTLVTFPKVPRFFRTLILISFHASVIAFICAILNGSYLFGHINCLSTIAAFVLGLPYHILSMLLIWLRKHQTESILKFTPTSTRCILLTGVCTVLWISSASLMGILLSQLTSGEMGRICYKMDDEDICHPLRGSHLVAPILAFALSVVEAIIMAAITVLSYLHGRQQLRHDPELNALELQPSRDSWNKVISP